MRNAKTAPALATIVMLLGAQSVVAHVTISPRESHAGIERYSMRVPTERDSATVRIEAEFPVEVSIVAIDAKEGWQIEQIRTAEGRIAGAIWSGGSIGPGEAEQFTFSARNPEVEVTLIWKVVQIHADGSRAEWIDAPGSRAPAPTTVVRQSQ